MRKAIYITVACALLALPSTADATTKDQAATAVFRWAASGTATEGTSVTLNRCTRKTKSILCKVTVIDPDSGAIDEDTGNVPPTISYYRVTGHGCHVTVHDAYYGNPTYKICPERKPPLDY